MCANSVVYKTCACTKKTWESRECINMNHSSKSVKEKYVINSKCSRYWKNIAILYVVSVVVHFGNCFVFFCLTQDGFDCIYTLRLLTFSISMSLFQILTMWTKINQCNRFISSKSSPTILGQSAILTCTVTFWRGSSFTRICNAPPHCHSCKTSYCNNQDKLSKTR